MNNENNVNNQQLSKKELKEQKKQEKKLMDKATNAIGTLYFLLLGFLFLIGLFIFRGLFVYLWYVVVPIIGAVIIIKFQIEDVCKKVTSVNYEKVKKAITWQLVLLGIVYFGVTINILSILIAISYIISSYLIIDAFNKNTKNIK